MNAGAQCGESLPLFVGNVDHGSPGPASPALTTGDRSFRSSANGNRRQLPPAWGAQGAWCCSSEEGSPSTGGSFKENVKKPALPPLQCNFKKSYSTLPRNGGT